MNGTYSSHDRLVDDWVTIWQSELAALAADRECAEQMQAGLAAWFASAALLRPHDGGSSLGPDAPARATPAAVAPDAVGTLARLELRVAELERRLAASGPSD